LCRGCHGLSLHHGLSILLRSGGHGAGDIAGSPCIMDCPRSLLPFCIERVYNLKQTYGVIIRGWGGEAANQKELEFSYGASKLSASRRACEGYTCCWLGSP